MNCGECTACCTVLKIDALEKPQYTPCVHCDKGCTIHKIKPQTCTEFECGYYQGQNIPVELRPDKCGIIFIKKTDRIFSGLIVPGVKVTDVAKGQIQAFNDQDYSVILIKQEANQPHLMLANDHKAEDIYREYQEYLNGNI